ncbi:MAG TPA: hypothetical protein VKO61_00940 [Candidatus Paceibacterota bacterium]|nr:hypothetical protein [Candidatus Paceibacterota bacterium]
MHKLRPQLSKSQADSMNNRVYFPITVGKFLYSRDFFIDYDLT